MIDLMGQSVVPSAFIVFSLAANVRYNDHNRMDESVCLVSMNAASAIVCHFHFSINILIFNDNNCIAFRFQHTKDST